MLDGSEFKRWREAAEGAKRSAELQAQAGLFNWACFMAEQAAQLAVKGLLHGMGAGAWGHDLLALGDPLSEQAGLPLPASVVGALQRLSRHYIPARYPDAYAGGSPQAHYGPDDATQALEDLAAVAAHVDNFWDELSRREAQDGTHDEPR